MNITLEESRSKDNKRGFQIDSNRLSETANNRTPDFQKGQVIALDSMRDSQEYKVVFANQETEKNQRKALSTGKRVPNNNKINIKIAKKHLHLFSSSKKRKNRAKKRAVLSETKYSQAADDLGKIQMD